MINSIQYITNTERVRESVGGGEGKAYTSNVSSSLPSPSTTFSHLHCARLVIWTVRVGTCTRTCTLRARCPNSGKCLCQAIPCYKPSSRNVTVCIGSLGDPRGPWGSFRSDSPIDEQLKLICGQLSKWSSSTPLHFLPRLCVWNYSKIWCKYDRLKKTNQLFSFRYI